MTFKNVANIGSVVTDKTIDSQSLLMMVNEARNLRAYLNIARYNVHVYD